MKIIKITKTFEVTDQNLKDFFCTAIEGGYSNYWMGWITFSQDDKEITYQALDYSKDFSWTIKDAEDKDEIYGPIFSKDITYHATLNKEIAKYLELLTDDSSFDAVQADDLLQLLTMNEIRFG